MHRKSWSFSNIATREERYSNKFKCSAHIINKDINYPTQPMSSLSACWFRLGKNTPSYLVNGWGRKIFFHKDVESSFEVLLCCSVFIHSNHMVFYISQSQFLFTYRHNFIINSSMIYLLLMAWMPSTAPGMSFHALSDNVVRVLLS